MPKKVQHLGKKRSALQSISVVNIDVLGSKFLMTLYFFIPYL